MKTIAVDFDGVIHAYRHGWLDGTIYDDLMPGAIISIKALQQTYAVFVHTSRPARPVAEWLAEHDLATCVEEGIAAPLEFWNDQSQILVTNRKLPAVAYLDDRAVRFTSWPAAIRELLPDDGYVAAHNRVRVALAAAWPDLSDDAVYLDQLAHVAARAATC